MWLKALNFDNFDISHNSFLWPEYFIDYLCERWIPCQASTSVLCLHYRSETVHCSTKDAYTSEITFLALHPWEKPSLCLSLSLRVSMSCNNNKHFAFISRPKTFFLQFLSMIKPFRNTYSETFITNNSSNVVFFTFW